MWPLEVDPLRMFIDKYDKSNGDQLESRSDMPICHSSNSLYMPLHSTLFAGHIA